MNVRAAETRKVLVFSPHPAFGGGVAEYSEILKRKLSPRIDADWFIIGRRPGRIGSILRALIPLFDSLRLMALLTSQRHDLYHLNPSFVPRSLVRDGLYLLVLRLFRRQNILVFFRGWDSQYFSRISKSPLKRALFVWIYGSATKVLVLGSGFAQSLAEVGLNPERLHVTTTMFDGEFLRNSARSRDDSTIRVLFLGRFVVAKGIYELLAAFQQVCISNPQVELLLAGDGEERARMERWCVERGIEANVRFCGYVRGPEKAKLLLDSDLFILPSYHGEGCPNALLEAMGAGLPVIVTPVGGIADLIQDGINGIVIPAKNTDAITDAILELAENVDARRTMGSNNSTQAWSRFEAAIVVDTIESHYMDFPALIKSHA